MKFTCLFLLSNIGFRILPISISGVNTSFFGFLFLILAIKKRSHFCDLASVIYSTCDFLCGGADGTYAMIGIVEKGYGDVKFVAKGNGGHSSVPAKNIPLVRLGKFMAYVEKH